MSGYSIYLDASGHPVDKPYVVIGGFIAREDRWIDFEKPWKELLRQRGIDFPFHATDFFYKHKSDPKLKHIVDDLVRVIANHVDVAFSVTIDVEAYKACNRERLLEEVSGTPYAIITKLIYKNVAEWQKRVGMCSPLLYFVEDGTMHKGDMMDCLRDRDGISPPIPVKKDNVACQAADLYAYAVYQSALLGGVPSDCFKAFMLRLPTQKDRIDSRVFLSDLQDHLASKCSVVVTEKYPEGVRVAIPARKDVGNVRFNFKGNKKKFRRATLGVANNDGKAKPRYSHEEDSQRLEGGITAPDGSGEAS